MPFLGEVRMFGGNVVPTGWMACDGQLLSTATYPQLFAVIGNRFGGDGVSTFALPDVRGRAPLHPGQGPGLTSRQLGESGGVEGYALGVAEIPAHAHTLRASTLNGSSDDPAGGVPARTAAAIPQFGASADVNLAAGAVANAGGGQPHNNMQPYLVVKFIIAIQGTAP